VALAALAQCPKVELCLVADGPGESGRVKNLDDATSFYPATPIADETLGAAMLYSSGTTGRPKGTLRPLPQQSPTQPLPLYAFLDKLWRYRDGMIYLSPAPLYHSAPQAAVSLTIDRAGTAVIMEAFDPERYLQLVQTYKVTHSQLVPTMFSRMLKLSEEVRRRYDLSSLEIAIHAAAPCPVQIKEQMIDWWGPIIHEYYGATEGLGFTACDSVEWLAHKGTVGNVLLGELHVLNAEMKPCPTKTAGTLWFKTAYVDEDGYLYLTDRANFMIISSGVNIYPQECENLLITHSKVADAAVFGVPNADLGEEVKAAVHARHCPRTGNHRGTASLLCSTSGLAKMPTGSCALISPATRRGEIEGGQIEHPS
jgi:long-chain acyl-CoA synthetase